MIRRFRYALTMVGDIAKIICPASAYVRARVDEVRDADVLTECEAETEVWEGYRFGPAAQRTEPTSELLFAAANQLDQVRNHLHFDHPREEYLSRLVPELRARAMSFVKQYD